MKTLELREGLVDLAYCRRINQVCKELRLLESEAADVVYLRSQSYWTSELEKQLISDINQGVFININTWP